MLAKILKNQSAVALTPFVIPIHGNTNNICEGVTTFAFPALTNIAVTAQDETVPVFNAVLPTEDLFETAKNEAAAIVAAAEAHKTAIEQAALEKGLQQANQTINAQVAAQTEDLRRQLSETIATIANLSSDIAAQAETDVVRLALEIARKIVVREVTIDREIALTLARIALGRLNSRAVAAVHLHPEDFLYVSLHREKLGFHGALELVEDRSIDLGGCLVRTETGDIDAGIESQFEEIAQGLIG